MAEECSLLPHAPMLTFRHCRASTGRACLSHPRFISGDINTDFIADEFPDGFQGMQLQPTQLEDLTVSDTRYYS